MYSCCRSDCYAVGLTLGPVAILNQNSIFEIASKNYKFCIDLELILC